ncbi:MAG: hypothetical protein KDB21_07150 [Acidimicrobiales bacterium]|nr:hypothetical protein [Acidimicrobiales bacterium]
MSMSEQRPEAVESEEAMSQSQSAESADAVADLLARIDEGLVELQGREIVAASAVADLLLDLRLLLTAAAEDAVPTGV